MTLLAQNIPLSNTLYEEQDFQNLDTRRRIAYLLWEASSNRPQPTSTNRPQLDRALPSKPNVRPRPPLKQALAPLKSDRNGGDKTTAVWWWAATVSRGR
eukprot:scaffold3021_cov182-Skeletonema_dohrnii-CCMP3373.AAC.6